SYADCYITGSSAMRSIVYKALTTGGQVFTATPTITVYDDGVTDSSAPQNANWMGFQGTLVGDGASTVYCHWSGSEAGITDIATQPAKNQQFLNSGALDGTDHGTSVPTGGQQQAHTVDLAMADNAFGFSAIYGNNPTPPTLSPVGSLVGIITFKWIHNNGLLAGTVAGQYDVTDQILRVALA